MRSATVRRASRIARSAEPVRRPLDQYDNDERHTEALPLKSAMRMGANPQSLNSELSRSPVAEFAVRMSGVVLRVSALERALCLGQQSSRVAAWALGRLLCQSSRQGEDGGFSTQAHRQSEQRECEPGPYVMKWHRTLRDRLHGQQAHGSAA